MPRRDILQKNLDTVTTTPSDLETKVSNEIMERYCWLKVILISLKFNFQFRFMKPLKNMNWEGIEARNYWNALRCLDNEESSAWNDVIRLFIFIGDSLCM
jgi:hypothetical protein